MNTGNVIHVLANMDFSQLGVAGIICLLLLMGLRLVYNYFIEEIKQLKLVIAAKDLIIAAKDAEYKQATKDYNDELREMEINAITTINKVIETLGKYESARRA
jgi:hypothetical protein